MFRSVEYAGWGASVYFVMWVIVGKYTFLTLFLAVTMEAFESKYDPKASREARVVAKLLRKKRERRKKRQVSLF
jgi:accessory gene regulator protein AgrB